MQIDQISHNDRTVSCQITARDSAFRLIFRFDGVEPDCITADGDMFLAAMLLPAMCLGEALRIEAPVSPQLLRGADVIQEIFNRWEPRGRQKIPVLAPEKQQARFAPGVGLFFSCGVDSFYSLLTRQTSVTHLLTVHGFDIDMENTGLFEQLRVRVETVASTFNKREFRVCSGWMAVCPGWHATISR